ncbi:unnamed protein product [Lampetra planeri]
MVDTAALSAPVRAGCLVIVDSAPAGDVFGKLIRPHRLPCGGSLSARRQNFGRSNFHFTFAAAVHGDRDAVDGASSADAGRCAKLDGTPRPDGGMALRLCARHSQDIFRWEERY